MKNKDDASKPHLVKRTLQRLLHLQDNQHSGRVLPAQQTSYGALLLILLLLLPQLTVYREVKGTQTVSGTQQVTATVPGPPPTTPATITSPVSSTVDTQTITVSGTCGPDLLVRIYRNDIFAGSTYCTTGGTFSLVVTLYTGLNQLRALNYDTLDQAGPDSPTIAITYTPPTTTTTMPGDKPKTGDTTIDNVILTVNYHLRQIEPKQPVNWQLAISNGQTPYNLTVDWGDGNSSSQQVENSSPFDISHTYMKPGRYKIIMKVTDKNGTKSQLQLAIVVNGPQVVIEPVSSTGNTCAGNSLGCNLSQNRWGYIIPLFWLLLIVLGVGWILGERHYRRHRAHHAHS